jgi:hypothetical protein
MKMSTKKIAVMVSAVALLVASIIAYFEFKARREYELEMRYRTVLEQLFQQQKDTELTPAAAGELLVELSLLIERKAGGDAARKKELRNDAAQRLSALFQSTSFDFGRYDRLQFDLIALKSWPEYKAMLEANPKANLNVLYRYSLALSELRQREPEFVRLAKVDAHGAMHSKASLTNGNDGPLLRDLNIGYSQHSELLRKSLDSNPEQLNKDGLLQSFCWHFFATENQSLSESVFGYDERQFAAERGRCEQVDKPRHPN